MHAKTDAFFNQIEQKIFKNGEWQLCPNYFLSHTHAMRFKQGDLSLNHVDEFNSQRFRTFKIANHSAFDLNEMIEKGREAQKIWQASPLKNRQHALKKWADLIAENIEILAEIIHLEQGKPLNEAQVEAQYSIDLIHYFADVMGEIFENPKESDIFTKRVYQGLGLVLAITPWNFPASMVARKVGAALAAGCSVLLKPSEITPLSALYLFDLACQTLPPELLQIITADTEQGKTLIQNACADKRIAKISLTGSTAVGKIIMQQSAASLKRLSLELGGAAFAIVDEGVDVAQTTQAIIENKKRNAGQTCISINTISVPKAERSLYFMHLMKNLKIAKNINYLVQPKAYERLSTYIQESINQGVAIFSPDDLSKLDELDELDELDNLGESITLNSLQKNLNLDAHFLEKHLLTPTRFKKLQQKFMQNTKYENVYSKKKEMQQGARINFKEDSTGSTATQNLECNDDAFSFSKSMGVFPELIMLIDADLNTRNTEKTAPPMHSFHNYELFGPIYMLQSHDHMSDIIAQVNACDYGLAAYAFTNQSDVQNLLIQNLEVGMLGLNTPHLSNVAFPFGGIKQSGFGIECSKQGIYEYLRLTAVREVSF